jgi:hypothetical protein
MVSHRKSGKGQSYFHKPDLELPITASVCSEVCVREFYLEKTMDQIKNEREQKYHIS